MEIQCKNEPSSDDENETSWQESQHVCIKSEPDSEAILGQNYNDCEPGTSSHFFSGVKTEFDEETNSQETLLSKKKS